MALVFLPTCDQRHGRIDVSGFGPGYYRLETTATTNGSTTQRNTDFAVLIRMLNGLQPTGRDALAAESRSYRFGTGKDTTRVLWSTANSQVDIAATGPLRLTDQFGRTRTLNPIEGRVTLPLSESPVFITGPVKSVTNG